MPFSHVIPFLININSNFLNELVHVILIIIKEILCCTLLMFSALYYYFYFIVITGKLSKFVKWTTLYFAHWVISVCVGVYG